MKSIPLFLFTPSQKIQNIKMKFIVDIAYYFKTIIKLNFLNKLENQNYHNSFIKLNTNYFQFENFDISKLIFSIGELEVICDLTDFTYLELSGLLSYRWSDKCDGNGSPDDTVNTLILYIPINDKLDNSYSVSGWFFNTKLRRNRRFQELIIPDLNMNDLYVFTWCSRFEPVINNFISDTQYVNYSV